MRLIQIRKFATSLGDSISFLSTVSGCSSLQLGEVLPSFARLGGWRTRPDVSSTGEEKAAIAASQRLPSSGSA
jgi:hypothetical protein